MTSTTSFSFLVYSFLQSLMLSLGLVEPSLDKLLASKDLQVGAPVYMRIFKQSKELEVWMQKDDVYVLFKTYPICTYSGDLGPKLREGDGQSPEGFYFVKPGQMNPNSKYHLSFNLGYPNAYDRAHGYTGSFLMVHGACVSIGCYAMTDQGIEEIYMLADEAHKAGQEYFRVHIFPFRMTAENMQKFYHPRWQGFWDNLKEGYDFFESKKRPPNVEVENMRYIFRDPI